MAIVYRAWFSLRSPARDSRWRMNLAAGGLQWGGAGVGGEMVLAREPTDVADLTEERGRQHRPHPEQFHQGRLGLRDRGLDTRLHCGDALLQLAGVGHELGGQLPTSDRRRTSR